MNPHDDQRRILGVALALNLLMFVVGLAAGLIAHSTSLIADSLDMLSDASAYGIGLLAIGRSARFKSATAGGSGVLLLVLGLGVLIEGVRRAVTGSEPIGAVMIGIACISLAVNSIVLHLLRRFRKGEVHLRATWIFTRADVIANIGVIVAGILVLSTGSRYPDLIIGLAIALYVIKEAFEILGEAREARRDSHCS